LIRKLVTFTLLHLAAQLKVSAFRQTLSLTDSEVKPSNGSTNYPNHFNLGQIAAVKAFDEIDAFIVFDSGNLLY
jgi:hypothetical protein